MKLSLCSVFWSMCQGVDTQGSQRFFSLNYDEGGTELKLTFFLGGGGG